MSASTCHFDLPESADLRTASFPGGLSPHYRVQLRDTQEESWQLYATYRDRQRAVECLHRLIEGGHQVRLVDCRSCASAV